MPRVQPGCAGGGFAWTCFIHCLTVKGILDGAGARGYPLVLELHRSFIAIARMVLNEDGLGGTALHPVVWSHAADPMARRVDRAVRHLAWLPGPASPWMSAWDRMPVAGNTAADVEAWPFSVGRLVKIAHFLGSLHWPRGAGDLRGRWGFHSLSFSFCMSNGLVRGWCWRKRCRWVGVRGAQFQCRLFRWVQALKFGAPVGSWVYP